MVSEVGLGTWPIGGTVFLGGIPYGYGEMEPDLALEILMKARELAVTFFSTSDAFGIGQAEHFVGLAIREKRNETVVATSVGGVPDGYTGWEHDVTPAYLEMALGRSLKRLGTDYLDVYLLQTEFLPEDYMERADDVANSFESFKRKGIIRAWGISLENLSHAGVWVKDYGAQVFQFRMNFLTQGAVESLFPLARSENIGLIARSPFYYGLLTGRYHRRSKFPKDDWRRVFDANELSSVTGPLKKFYPLVKGSSKNYMEAAVKYILSYPEISSVVPGARSSDQLKVNVKSVSGGYMDIGQRDLIYKTYQDILHKLA
ncbi:MAG: aldo/keto reductase [bacterium]